MSTTNYSNAFISVAEDCPAQTGTVPPGGERPTVARLTWEIITSAAAYSLTSDDVLFAVHAARCDIPDELRAQAREEFFARPQACLRSSPLTKTYGWGVHFDAAGRVALYGRQTERYLELSAPGAAAPDGTPLDQRKAMRNRRG